MTAAHPRAVAALALALALARPAGGSQGAPHPPALPPRWPAGAAR